MAELRVPLNIGVLCNWLPYPITNGSNRRLAELIGHLADSGHQVDLVVIGQKYWWRRYLAKLPVRSVRYLASDLLCSPLAWVQAVYWFVVDMLTHVGLPSLDDALVRFRRFSGTGSQGNQVDYWQLCPDGVAAAIPPLASSGAWNAVIVEYLWLHPLVDALPAQVTRILDTHDVMYLRHQRLSREGLHSPFPIDEFQEASLLGKFDCIVAIQDAERQSFLRLKESSGLACEVITLGVSCHHAAISGQGGNDSKVLLFVGGMNMFNEEGLRHFIDRLWPQIYQAHPDWGLHVCGPICSRFTGGQYLGVEFFGVVDDLAPHYGVAAAVVNPVRSGTGLKIKTIEALAYGKPLLTTSSGIEGMAGAIAGACLVASDDAGFIDKALHLIEHPDARIALAASARAYFDMHLAAGAVYKEFDRYLETI